MSSDRGPEPRHRNLIVTGSGEDGSQQPTTVGGFQLAQRCPADPVQRLQQRFSLGYIGVHGHDHTERQREGSGA